MPRKVDSAIILCRLEPTVRASIESYAEDLRKAAPGLGQHGLESEEFWRSGLFRGAIERIRGTFSATTSSKQAFVADVLNWLQQNGRINGWVKAGAQDRHDYEVSLLGNRVCAIEAKGCLDGNNTNIFQRPANADEFVIWSLCQNPGADPRHNAWSGIHTRLSAEVVHKREIVDAVIIWDELCGTIGRPCPKLKNIGRGTEIGSRVVPPPCIYLFPRTIPDARNNPKPPVHRLEEVRFAKVLFDTLRCNDEDVTEVSIEAAMNGSTLTRRTVLRRRGQVVQASAFSRIKRAK